jgi:hypothetical protein
VLIHGQALSDNEFCLEVGEAGVIETELALQSAIGNTAAVAEQRYDLIDDLIKVHASLPMLLPAGHVAVRWLSIPKPQPDSYGHRCALSYCARVEHKIAVRRYRMQERVELLDSG